jgi:hypothetical protein
MWNRDSPVSVFSLHISIYLYISLYFFSTVAINWISHDSSSSVISYCVPLCWYRMATQWSCGSGSSTVYRDIHTVSHPLPYTTTNWLTVLFSCAIAPVCQDKPRGNNTSFSLPERFMHSTRNLKLLSKNPVVSTKKSIHCAKHSAYNTRDCILVSKFIFQPSKTTSTFHSAKTSKEKLREWSHHLF